MRQSKATYRQAKQLKTVIDLVENELGQVLSALAAVEAGIAEDFFQCGVMLPADVEVQGLVLNLVEAPDVVEPVDMIGVGVGDNNGVEATDIVTQSLQTELGGSVDEHIFAVKGDQLR